MADKDRVRWKNTEPGVLQQRPSIQIVKVRPNNKVLGFFLSDRVECVDTHWIGGRTQPCMGDATVCDGHRMGLSIRPKGYVAVQLGADKTVWILEITESAFDSNLALSRTSGLRGVQFEARRKHANINSELIVDTYEGRRPNFELAPDIDVKDVLCRIWFGKSKNRTRKEGTNGE
jgi:hypothetical protein